MHTTLKRKVLLNRCLEPNKMVAKPAAFRAFLLVKNRHKPLGKMAKIANEKLTGKMTRNRKTNREMTKNWKETDLKMTLKWLREMAIFSILCQILHVFA